MVFGPRLVACADPTQLAEFIYSEYCLRVELQETPSPEEYYRRFPTVVEPLRRLFESRKQNPAKAASVPPSPPEFDSLEEIPAKVVSGTEPKTPAARTLQPQTPREPVRVPPRPVEMTTSGTVSGDTDANVTQAGTRDKSDTVVSTLEESYSGQIFGRYELIQELGRGGMGVVWKARDVDLDRFVAIKLILPNHVESEVGIKRFQAEARASARLDHPGIVTVHDFGQRDGKYYLCMAFVDGRSLAERLAQGVMPSCQSGQNHPRDRRGDSPRARAGRRPSRLEAAQHPADLSRRAPRHRLRPGPTYRRPRRDYG